MSKTQQAVLRYLAEAGARGTFVYSLASAAGIEEPSVRRTVRELRAQGWNISFSGAYAPYVLASGERARALDATRTPVGV